MRFYQFIFVLLTMVFPPLLQSASLMEDEGNFSGRVAKINDQIKLLRVKVNFANMKYLNPKDQAEFWEEKNPNQKCKGYLVGRSADYILLKVPELNQCQGYLNISQGAYFKFFSQDLSNNIKMGREVMSILVKKRMAVLGQIEVKNQEITKHIERVNALNARYHALREKLEEEWQKELHALEEDRTYAVRSYKDLERRRDEIDQKLELYKIQDENLTLDRWSLDSSLYFKK